MRLTKKHLTTGIITLSLAFLVVAPAVLAGTTTLTPINTPRQNYFLNRDLMGTAEVIINSALGFLGLVAVVIILIGGFQWMTAGGGEEKIKKAKGTLSAGIIGLVIIMAAWGIAQFVISIVRTE